MYITPYGCCVDKCQVLAPVGRHLLLSSPSISRSQTGCRVLGHLTPCLTPQSPSPSSLLLLSTSFSPISYQCSLPPSFHPANSLHILTSVFSLWASVVPFPQAPSLFPFLPPTGWAVKQERAHGRPLTTRNSALELRCGANDCRLFYTTTEPSMVGRHTDTL